MSTPPASWETVRDVLAEYLCADWSDDDGLGCADEPPCWSHYVEAGEALTALGAEPPPDCPDCGHPVAWHGETGENQCKRRDVEGHRCPCHRNMPAVPEARCMEFDVVLNGMTCSIERGRHIHTPVPTERTCGHPTGAYDVTCARPIGHDGGHVGPFWVEPKH